MHKPAKQEEDADLSFHYFPSSFVECRRWLVAIKRDEGKQFRVTKNTVVCGEHFRPEDFTLPPDLSLRRRLKSGAVPSIFAFTKQATVRASPAERRVVSQARLDFLQLPKFGPLTETEALKAELRQAKEQIKTLEEKVTSLDADVKLLRTQIFRSDNIKRDGQKLMFLTGLNVGMWSALWQFLKPSPTDVISRRSAEKEAEGRLNCPGAGRKPSLTMEDELLLTLMRLRLGRLEKDLAYQFGVTESCISRIIVKWLNFLYLRLGLIPIWPDWEDVERTMPVCFKEAYPTTFATLDATELFCEVPSSLSSQSQHYSAYKSHTTMKGLVAIAPNGAFIFVSQLYTGSISDRELFVQSGIDDLLKKVPPGRSIMVDRGFEVQDLILKHGLLLNIPPFKGKQRSLSLENVKKTQQIARLRIHVERAIGQVKARFRVFRSAIPLSLSGSANQMWSVCCMLTNFLGPLIAESNAEEE